MRLLPEPMGKIREGSILFRGKDLASQPESGMRKIRGDRISMIFQEPMTSLNPVLTVGYQLEEALFSHKSLTSSERTRNAAALLEAVGLPDATDKLREYPHQLSGGMRQRVMIAMALACNPDLLIADEPTTALDVTIQAQILDILKKLQQDRGMSVILITHNLGVVAETARRILVMYAGKIVESSSTENIFRNPSHPYTRGLLDSIPRLGDSRKDRCKLATIPGMVPHPFDFPEGCRFHPRCPFAMGKCRVSEPPLFSVGDSHQAACWLYEPGAAGRGVDIKTPRDALPAKTEPVSPDPVLEIRNLQKTFEIRGKYGGRDMVKAVSDVSLDIFRGETLGLVGESGCGKSTTGKTIVGLENPTKGQILWKGRDSLFLKGGDRDEFRRKVQMVFQDPYSSLNPRMTVKEIVAEGVEIHNLAKSEKQKEEMVSKALKDAGLRPEYMVRYPHEFSGGQRQRIGIARALVMNPELIVCDEPVSALDVSIQAQVINLLQDLQREHGLTYLFIAHDLSVVRHISDRVAVMYLGMIMEQAETDTLFEEHRHPYTEALLSAVPEPDPADRKGRIILEGDLPSPVNLPQGCPFNTRCHRKKGRICEEKRPPLVDLGNGHKAACWWVAE